MAQPQPATMSDADRRGSRRIGIALLRAARLLTADGECLCLLRDVSRGGVGLRFFHAVPPDRHVLLVSAEGRIHPLIRCWTQGCAAGYRAVNPIDPADFLAEKRGAGEVMLRLDCPARLRRAGATLGATLTGIGPRRMRLAIDGFCAIGQPVVAVIKEDTDLGGWVEWRNGERAQAEYGIALERVLPLDVLALLARRLQTPGAGAARLAQPD